MNPVEWALWSFLGGLLGTALMDAVGEVGERLGLTSGGR
jgi:hypothetical protein